jgi:uncharacterized membrane protein
LIRSEPVLAAVLAGLVAAVLQAEKLPALRPLFGRLPPVVWTYLLPMLLTSAGVLPAQSPLYAGLGRYLLPASLVLLLLASELRAVARLGRLALLAMLAGAVGIVAGVAGGYWLLRPWLPADAWRGAGALAATWIGGSLNLVAVARALEYDPGVVIGVDTVVGYSYMALLIALASRQDAFDRWNRADRGAVDEAARRVGELQSTRRPASVADLTLMIGLAGGLTVLALEIGERLPPVGEVLRPFSWAVLLLTSLALLLSLTPLAVRLEQAGASSLGYAGFYLLLASIGAQGDLRRLLEQPVFVALGVLALAVHLGTLLLAVRLLRAPLFFLGAASQACVGGYSSAPIVAAIYQPGTASVGLLLAVLGNLAGTYVGLALAQGLAALP